MTVNHLGMDWLKREFPQFKFKIVKHTNGHLDSYFSVVKPGLAISGIAKNKLPDEFKNWTILEFGKEDYTDVSVVSNFFMDGRPPRSTLAVNAFSIDENNIIMSKHTVDTCPKQIKVIEDCGINVIPLEFDVSRWLNQGIHCLSNPLVRDGGLINYF